MTTTPDYFEKTKTAFKSLIKKPKLQDRYLRKPPFRFIHDIIINTMKSTGFPSDLFTVDEQNGKLIKDKASKLSFLNKLILCMESVTGEKLSVNLNKLVSGLEPENTNIMLQKFAAIAEKVANKELDMNNILLKMNGDSNSSKDTQSKSNSIIAQSENISKNEEAQPPSAREKLASKQISRPMSAKPSQILSNNNETPAWVISTQETLGKLIQRPRLIEKLLKRPPFRFLHDIIKSLIKETQYPSPFLDMNADISNANVKDIDEDLSFIDPKQIIAGAEPQNTNYLLTKLANAATSNFDENEVRQKIAAHEQGKKNEIEEQKKILEQRMNEEKKRIKEQKNEQEKHRRKQSAKKPIMPKLELENIKKIQNSSENDIKYQSPMPPTVHTPVVDQQQSQQKLIRPRTARRAPPKLKSNLVQTSASTSSSAVHTSHSNSQKRAEDVLIIDDGVQNESLDGIENEFLGNMNGNMDSVDENDGGIHGKLVRDILDAQSGVKLNSSRISSSTSNERNADMRDMIQKSCQTCLPLGKCIDMAPENIACMDREFFEWQQEITECKSTLIQEIQKTKHNLKSMVEELRNVERKIEDEKNRILAKKAVLFKNEHKIQDIIDKQLMGNY